MSSLDMKKASVVLFSLCMGLVSGFSEPREDPAMAYISRYAETAVREMHRTGVPASITLAQGMLESGNGLSVLAVEANNHFGIKCHGEDWTGETISMDDDAKGECFRKYPRADDSFVDHSDFLRFRPRYATLFELETSDYKGWAYGLKSAGYATDPEYANKLISKVEKYNLGRFDVMKKGEVPEIPQTPLELERPERFVSAGAPGKFNVTLEREVLQLNGIPFVYAREGETYKSIAGQYDLFASELESYNDAGRTAGRLAAGEVVFLQRKARKAAKGLDYYVCSEGDNLRDISQRFAIRLSSLMKMNKIKDLNKVLQEDDMILLRPLSKNTDKYAIAEKHSENRESEK